MINIFSSSEKGKIWRIFLVIIIFVVMGSLVDSGDYYNKGVDFLAAKTNNTIKLPRIDNPISFRLGLDLQGGTHLVYSADMSSVPAGEQISALEGVRDVIERRVNVFGVSEPLVQTNTTGGDYRVIVELAGIKDVGEAISMIGETPLLEFKEEDDTVRELTDEEKTKMNEFNEDAEKKAEEVFGKVISGGDFASLASEFSMDTNTKDNGGDLGWLTTKTAPQIVEAVRDLNPGDVVDDIVQMSNGYEVLKLVEKRNKVNPFDEAEVEKEVKASHILICHDESERCDTPIAKDDAYAKIKEIKERANASNFAALAQEHSTGPSSVNGGDLGWFDKTTMVKPFADTVFAQEIGTISFVVETKFGYHLIHKVDERDLEEFRVSHIFIPTITEKDIVGEQNDWKNTELTGKNLKRSVVQFNPNDNMPEVGLEFDSEGALMFAEITERNVEKQVAIFLDGYIISAPRVNSKITGGKAVISGGFNINEAKVLAQRLNAGALPVPIELISQQTVGSSLGNKSLTASLKAGLIGLILVAIFMILYYRLPGILAVFSLAIYGVWVLAVFKLWPVTLSLSGMAGFILSIGMAVDANVLIFERLKEELKSGKPLSLAVNDSFDRAWPSIRDGNISTLITCFILIQFSTSIVKGFAITLGLGVLVSMLSAIVVTKTFLNLVAGDWLDKVKWLVGVKTRN